MELENFKYNLSRLKKCNQYWDEMKPVTGGRHCNKCEKKIVDFSAMSFTDIAFYMAESKEPVCGFYRPEQLEQIKSYKTQLPLAIGLTTLLTTSTVSKAENNYNRTEQNVVEKESLQDSASETSRIGDNYLTDTVYFTGNIQSFDTTKKMSLPVSYASVIIKGTKTGVSAMENGTFKLPYLPTYDICKIYLVVMSVGLETREIEVNYSGQKQIDLGTITLNAYERDLSEFWVTTKKRSALGRLWFKITKPFR
jgi:hypothetical protein